MIFRLGIDALADERESSESAFGPFAFREAVASYDEVDSGSVVVPAGTDEYLLTKCFGHDPLPVHFVLLRSTVDVQVRLGTTGAWFWIRRMDPTLGLAPGHAYLLATPDGVDGVWLRTQAEAVVKWMSARDLEGT